MANLISSGLQPWIDLVKIHLSRNRKLAAAAALTVFLSIILLVIFIKQPVLVHPTGKPFMASDPQRLRRDVLFLTEDPHRRSYPRIAELDRAADYIHKAFAETGARVEEQRYEIDGNPDSYRNIIATFGPETGERVIVGAHYDSWGGLPGADDNASGTAGLLEIARLLSKEKLAYRVDLVAYSLEEPPFFRTETMGSFQHAAMLQSGGVKLRGMICLEMIGYFSDVAGSQKYPIPGMSLLYPSKADFITVVGGINDVALLRRVKKAMVVANPLPVMSVNAPAAIPGIDFSDHWSYWQHGYSAVMVSDTAFYRNDHYHTARDTAQTLDFDRMALVVDKVFMAIQDLAK